jgi:hypothetical protein
VIDLAAGRDITAPKGTALGASAVPSRNEPRVLQPSTTRRRPNARSPFEDQATMTSLDVNGKRIDVDGTDA